MRHLPSHRYQIIVLIAVLGILAIPLQPTAAATLGEALDNTNLTWTTTVGLRQWIVETTNFVFGSSAVQSSPNLVNGSGSSVQTTVTGPGTLRYWWAATTTTPNCNFHTFSLDGTAIDAFPACMPFVMWASNSFPIGAGVHTLSWNYTNYNVTAAGNAAFLDHVEFVRSASVTISNLAQTYDGTAKAVTVTTSPTNLATTVRYNDSAVVPTNAGSYTVVATVSDPTYEGSATNTLIIIPAVAVVTLGNLAQTYDGTPKSVSVATSPPGLGVSVTYDGLNIAPVSRGDYLVIATVTNSNYQGSATNTLVIASPPNLSVHPRDATTWPGGVAKFHVNASGVPPFTYFLKRGSQVVASRNATTETNVVLQLTNLHASALGGYGVVVTNVFGTTSQTNLTLSFANVAAWGINDDGQADVPAGLTNAVGIAGGDNFSVALRSDGTVKVWGYDSFDKTNVPPDLTNAIAVGAGNSHVLALRADQSVVCWGNNSEGQTNVPPDLTNAVAIAGGIHFSVALTAGGRVRVWGHDINNLASTAAIWTNIVAIASGSLATTLTALKADGRILVAGDNTWGATNAPTDLTNVIAVAAGNIFNMALTGDGRVHVWGDKANFWNVTNVPPDLTNVVAISAGSKHCLALKADGAVTAWGYWQDTTNLPSGFMTAASISAGGGHSLALVRDGFALPTLSATLQNPTVMQGGFSLTLPTENGRAYLLEYNDSFPNGEWNALNLVPGNGGSLTLTDPSVVSPARFYRVRRW